MILDIGGGTSPVEGRDHHVENLDPVHGKGPWKRLAQDTPWPVFDDWFDEVNASHVMEHIPAGAPRIAVMNEVHRVLDPKGTFTIIVPLFPHPWAIADPTHVSYWVSESFQYFDQRMLANADYGIRPWTTVSFKVRDGWEGRWVGRPVK